MSLFEPKRSEIDNNLLTTALVGALLTNLEEVPNIELIIGGSLIKLKTYTNDINSSVLIEDLMKLPQMRNLGLTDTEIVSIMKSTSVLYNKIKEK